MKWRKYLTIIYIMKVKLLQLILYKYEDYKLVIVITCVLLDYKTTPKGNGFKSEIRYQPILITKKKLSKRKNIP